MLRRETIIALRARHTAFRIAIEILYPHQTAPGVADPIMPIIEGEGRTGWDSWRVRRRRRITAIVLTAGLFLCLLFMLYAITVERVPPWPPPSPPVPQGRPILP